MLAPETDAYAPVIRFDVPRNERMLALCGALALAAGAAMCLVALPASVPARLFLGGGLIFLCAILAVRACRAESVEMDLAVRICRRRSGLRSPARETVFALFGPVRLLYTSVEHVGTADGIPVRVVSCDLEAAGQRVPVIRHWSDPQAEQFLVVLAERLEAGMEPDAAPAGRRRWDAGGVVVWTGIALVFTVMFWPILSGRRPIRFALASATPDMRMSPQRAHYLQGSQLYDAGQFENAEMQFREALSSGLDPAEAYNMIAYAQAGQKRLDDALATAQKALGYAPESGMIIDTVGEMHELRKDYEDAVKYYELALTKPDMGGAEETHAKLGRTLVALHRNEEAIPHLTLAARKPDVKYGKIAADILRKIGAPVPRSVPPIYYSNSPRGFPTSAGMRRRD